MGILDYTGAVQCDGKYGFYQRRHQKTVLIKYIISVSQGGAYLA
jgi:hypothetical protein